MDSSTAFFALCYISMSSINLEVKQILAIVWIWVRRGAIKTLICKRLRDELSVDA